MYLANGATGTLGSIIEIALSLSLRPNSRTYKLDY